MQKKQTWLQALGRVAPLALAAAFAFWVHPLLPTYLDHPVQRAAAFGFIGANLFLFLSLVAPPWRWSAALESVAVLAWCVGAHTTAQYNIGGATRVLAWRHDLPAVYWVLRIGALAFPVAVLAAVRFRVPRPAVLAAAVFAALGLLTPVASFHFHDLDEDEVIRSAVAALETQGERDELGRAGLVWRYVSSELTHGAGSVMRSPDQILADGRGTCGSASKLLASALRAAGFATRIVNIVDQRGAGHVVVEAYVAGRWRMYDANLRRLYPDESDPMGMPQIVRTYGGRFPDTRLEGIRYQFLTRGGFIPFEEDREAELYARPTSSSIAADLPGGQIPTPKGTGDR